LEWAQLTPFVATRVEKEAWKKYDEEGEKLYEKPGSGKEYLDNWKTLNGQY
jgi:hypothetical protein